MRNELPAMPMGLEIRHTCATATQTTTPRDSATDLEAAQLCKGTLSDLVVFI